MYVQWHTVEIVASTYFLLPGWASYFHSLLTWSLGYYYSSTVILNLFESCTLSQRKVKSPYMPHIYAGPCKVENVKISSDSQKRLLARPGVRVPPVKKQCSRAGILLKNITKPLCYCPEISNIKSLHKFVHFDFIKKLS